MTKKPTYEELEKKIRELEKEIAECKQVEELLIIEKEFTEFALNSQHDTFFVFEPATGKAIRWNKTFRDITGYTDEEIASLKAPNSYYSQEDLKKAASTTESVMRNGMAKIELHLICKDGRRILTEYNVSIMPDKNGESKYMVSNGRNITERKRLEEAKERSERLLKQALSELEAIIEALPGMVSVVDLEFNTLVANTAVIEKFGHSNKAEVLGLKCYKARKGLDDICPQCGVKQAYDTGKPVSRLSTPEEEKFMGISTKAYSIPLKDEKGKIWGGVEVIMDVTDLRQKEKALKESEEKYRTILESIEDGYYELDMKGNFIFLNDSMCRILGYSKDELMGMNNRQYLDGENAKGIFKTFNKVYKTGQPYKAIDWELIRKDGSRCYVETSVALKRHSKGQPIGFQGIARDISERKKNEKEKILLEKRLRQSQKMESIGTLAGGIAHDFNNILFPIVGYTEMLLEDVPEDSPFKDSLNNIYTSALRAKNLVKQILTFSRQDSNELMLMKVQPIIKEALKLIRSTIPTTIEIKQDINPDCGVIKVDPTQIHQVVMNLATNAYHAMEDTGGELKVSLKEVELGTLDLINPNMAPGVYVCLTVADTGLGMDKNLTDKIFDPFFTTKEKSKGTGMGLSVVHGIVTAMGGAIHVYSEPGKGSQFHVYLPVEKSFSEEEATTSKAQIQGGTEQILLVDDEEAILSMEKRMLERLGYQVTSRVSSLEGLEAFRDSPDKFDLVITDMAMPNMPGDRLSVELTKIRPDIPVLLCTGFSESMSEEKAGSLGIKGFLFKPIVMKDLAQKIREVLDKN